MESKFKAELLKDEKILWTGQPGGGLFAPVDIFLVPFSLLWGGFAISWELAALGWLGFASKEGHSAPFFFPLFGGVFVVVGLYFIFGRFFYKVWKKNRTWYAVTNKRVLVLIETSSRKTQAAFIKQVSTINKRVRSDGSGSLRFGSASGFGGMAGVYENTGLDFFGSFHGDQPPSFHQIPKVDNVYRLVADLQQEEA